LKQSHLVRQRQNGETWKATKPQAAQQSTVYNTQIKRRGVTMTWQKAKTWCPSPVRRNRCSTNAEHATKAKFELMTQVLTIA